MHGIDSRYCTLADSCSNIIIHYTDLMWYEYLIICCLLMNIHVWYFFSQIIILPFSVCKCLCTCMLVFISSKHFFDHIQVTRGNKREYLFAPCGTCKGYSSGTQIVLKWSIVNKDFIITFFSLTEKPKMVEHSKAVCAFLFTMHTYYKDRQNLSNKDKFS